LINVRIADHVYVNAAIPFNLVCTDTPSGISQNAHSCAPARAFALIGSSLERSMPELALAKSDGRNTPGCVWPAEMRIEFGSALDRREVPGQPVFPVLSVFWFTGAPATASGLLVTSPQRTHRTETPQCR
jgi:hypothetical protein